MKNITNADKSFILSGLHYGENGFIPEEILDEIEIYGKGYGLAMIRPTANNPVIDDEVYLKLAQYFKEKKIYFMTLYGVQFTAKDGKPHLSRELVEKLYEVGGEYFLGDSLGETGSAYATKPLNHGVNPYRVQSGLKDMQEAKDHYVDVIRQFVQKQKENGMRITWNLESTTLVKYSYEAGVDICNVELMLGNPEHILAFGRGAARGYGKEFFGTYVAHEWYGGMRQTDPLKMKRLLLAYNESYIAGSNMLLLEEGVQGCSSFEKLDVNHPVVTRIRKDLDGFNKFIKEDERPARGPIVKVAFISGNLDGYPGHSWAYGGVSSSVWAQHDREEWGCDAPERSFKILDDVYRSCDWHNTVNYGDNDYSNAPAYGQYDVLPAEAPLSAMEQYDWLIFTGWNTMTDEIYNNLKEFVSRGGNLLISAAHLKTGATRGAKSDFISDEKMSEFLGCRFTGKTIRTNNGFKFARESIIDGILYPGAPDYACDTAGSCGYTDYLEVKLTTGRKAALLNDTFAPPDLDKAASVLVENKYGKGNVLFMTTEEYPGAEAVYPLYQNVVKSILTATHRMCDIKVVCNDKVRFGVFENDSIYKVYLLNTDMNVRQNVCVSYEDECVEKSIASAGIDSVVFEKKLQMSR